LLVTAVTDSEIDADATFVEEIAELFDWTLTRSVDVSIEVTIKGTLTIPLGKDISDFNANGFDLDLSLDRYTNDGSWDWEQSDYDIEEIND
jgi:phosphoglucomutase